MVNEGVGGLSCDRIGCITASWRSPSKEREPWWAKHNATGQAREWPPSLRPNYNSRRSGLGRPARAGEWRHWAQTPGLARWFADLAEERRVPPPGVRPCIRQAS